MAQGGGSSHGGVGGFVEETEGTEQRQEESAAKMREAAKPTLVRWEEAPQ